MPDVLDRIGFSVDWSNPLADALDSTIRGAVKQLGLDDLIEKVSGDNELLAQTAAEWRSAARDMQGVVDDLEAERKTLVASWTGDASEAFSGKLAAFEEALRGEAEDMTTVAELLEMAAESCAEAEQVMLDLVVEIVEALLAAAATAAIVAVLTAGVGAAVGPLIGAAGTASRVMKAARITAKLAEKLKSLAEKMRALRKLRKLRVAAKRAWRHKDKNYKIVKNAVKFPVKAALGAHLGGAAMDAAPLANDMLKDATGVDVGAKVSAAAEGAERTLHETTGLDYVRMGDHTWDVAHQTPDGEEPKTPQEQQYANRPEPESFRDRVGEQIPAQQRPVQDVFG
ncbi:MULTISPECIES: WXG100 family type VII secretion target [unclassified Streptomyces]|uniref:WXG100 family type VII secretion target n=1 Tax=unclassified Streptomyces TaxID=2593676 RepID=UPI00278BECBC|nr:MULTISPECIES: WXG100 family type VII secretion target [unclassified Streptomyces]